MQKLNIIPDRYSNIPFKTYKLQGCW